MKRAALVAGSVSALLCAGWSALPATAEASTARATDDRVYLVVLREAPAAAYRGGIATYAATAPQAGRRFDSTTEPVEAYRGYLAARQDAVLAGVGGPTPLYSYTTALNGFAASLDAAQVMALESDPAVLLVQPDQRVALDGTSAVGSVGSVGAVGAVGAGAEPAAPTAAASASSAATSELWRQVGGPEQAGRGVVVGVIDSGVWPDNPALAGLPVGSSALQRGYPGFSGSCQTGPGWTESACSSKIIAARYFVRGFGRANIATSDYLSPRDAGGHGTSVAAIAAGNAGVDTRIGRQDLGQISGQAPAAALSVYKACWTAPNPALDGCDVADTLKAIDEAVADGVDVLNYSIAGTTSSLADPVQLAFLGAAAAHVFVATAAGNGGPTSGTVEHPAPWVTTVGANTKDVFEGGVRLGDGRLLVGAMLSNRRVGPARLVYAGDAAAPGQSPRRARLCYPGSLDAQHTFGAIVVCDRGVTSRVSKSAAVAQAGGRAMVLVNTAPDSVDADFHRVPTVHLAAAAGARVKAYIAAAGRDATASIDPDATNDPLVPVVAGFSGRGPTAAAGGDLLKPDLTAAGVSVITATAPTGESERLWDVRSGTSMSAPHVAGVAAVVRGAHPTWSPAAVESAMQTTARPLSGPAGPLVSGAGELDPTAVLTPGLVYDAGPDDWSRLLRGQGLAITGLSADPASTLPSNLNAASIMVGQLVGDTTVTRVITNVGDSTERYAADITGLPGIARSVSPANVTLRPGQSARFDVTLSANGRARYGVFAAGTLAWTSTSGRAVTSPVVVRPVLAELPAAVSGTGRSGSISLQARAGVTGSLHPVTLGLVAATPVPLALRSGDFDPQHPAASAAATAVTVAVGADTRAARFQVSSPDAGDDLDLYVYRDGALVASATGDAPEQAITLSDPAPGSYRVFATAARAIDGTPGATLTSWVLPRGNQGNLRAGQRSIRVTGGEQFTVRLDWTDLDPGRRWWGLVGLRDLPGSTSVTIN